MAKSIRYIIFHSTKWLYIPDITRNFGCHLVYFVRVLPLVELAVGTHGLALEGLVFDNLHTFASARLQAGLLVDRPVLPDQVLLHRHRHGDAELDSPHFLV